MILLKSKISQKWIPACTLMVSNVWQFISFVTHYVFEFCLLFQSAYRKLNWTCTCVWLNLNCDWRGYKHKFGYLLTTHLSCWLDYSELGLCILRHKKDYLTWKPFVLKRGTVLTHILYGRKYNYISLLTFDFIYIWFMY